RDFHVTGVQTCALPILLIHLVEGDGGLHLLQGGEERLERRRALFHEEIVYADFLARRSRQKSQVGPRTSLYESLSESHPGPPHVSVRRRVGVVDDVNGAVLPREHVEVRDKVEVLLLRAEAPRAPEADGGEALDGRLDGLLLPLRDDEGAGNIFDEVPPPD